MRFNRTHIPWAMAVGRAALGPVLAVGAACQWNGLALAGIVLTALLSDIFDGVLARRWHCDTAAVRLFDTLADTFFYLWTGWALWLASPAIWRQNAPLIAAVVALEILHAAFDLAKFGRPASYHSYLAKTWGLVLASGVITAFALHRGNAPLTLALWIGIACKLEGIAMSLILPAWHRDIKTLAAAWRIRRRQPANASTPRARRLAWFAFIALATLLLGNPAFAAVEGRPGVSRQIAATCSLVERRATQYLEEHDFYTSTAESKGNIDLNFGNLEKSTLPSGKTLNLNRFSIRRYVEPRHLSPFKTYDDFRLRGELQLKDSGHSTCNANLSFEISTYEYAWPLAAIDDGYRSWFITNGTLESIYLTAIDSLREAK